ncbi:hypothetical protein W02_37680 [Nitrospira sp. KM1]|uniref:DUF3649 domain-containing protein n=1 Tax=Nitrospira sp. KM1 TaxID=1936990 RepID=UPI0013A762F1|nr:DUF3649 domain-containing protein [Nitrospira sp. KM1]BCA56628.1 hypothetical protein W02_37680 [Nitrospira sp. KM1]
MGNVKGIKRVSWQHVASRTAAAVLGGYALAYAATACLTLILPLAKSEAVLTAAMLSFVWYTGAILWAFAAATPRRAWIGVVVPTICFAAVAFQLTSVLGP